MACCGRNNSCDLGNDTSFSDSESDSDSEYSSSDCEDLRDHTRTSGAVLPFNPGAIEKILLMLFEKFDFRLLMEGQSKGAMLVTAGFAIAGGLVGQHFAGKVGAAVGGAVGGACGVGVVAISMKEAWEELKYKLSELMDLVYDFLAGLELKDYASAARLLKLDNALSSCLAQMLLTQASSTLGKNIVSSLT